MHTRPQSPETRKRLARFRVLAWTPASAPRAPECQPMQTTLASIGSILARQQRATPPRPPVSAALAAAASTLKGGRS